MGKRHCNNNLLLAWAAFWLFLLIPDKPASGAEWFVHNGSGMACSMDDPCPFSLAQSKASAGDTVYFKTGTYAHNNPHYLSDLISVTKSLILLGGWDGASSGPVVRDPETYSTILDGEGERRVMKISGLISPTIDGFTIQNGNASGLVGNCTATNAQGCGGGIFVYQAGPQISNNKIFNNNALEATTIPGAYGYGGGVYLEAASEAVLESNLLQGNQSNSVEVGLGGGLAINGTAAIPPRVEKNRFIKNKGTGTGGIVYFDQTNPSIKNNFFEQNNGTDALEGIAGIYGWGPATISHNLFQNNQSPVLLWLINFQGTFESNKLLSNNTSFGILLISSSPPDTKFINNVIVGSGSQFGISARGHSLNPLTVTMEHNTVVGEGTGIGIQINNYCSASLTNNILSGYPIGINNQGMTVTARHTLFDTSVTTQGNNVNFVNSLVGDPAFKNPAANDYHIRSNSAARDAGTSPVMATEDIDGDPRIIGSAPDIGADEYRGDFLYLPLLTK